MSSAWMSCVVALMTFGCRGQESTPRASTSPSASTAPAATVPSASSSVPSPSAVPSEVVRWSFDADPIDSAPKGFSFARTGSGHDGKWLVRAEVGAPSGANVLLQVDADPTEDRFPIAFAEAPIVRDVDLSVRCKTSSGAIDRACGLVFRLEDANNYYLTRANALENNVRLYFVKDGKRRQIATWNGNVTSGVWHEYRVIAKDRRFIVFWDGARVIDQEDETFVRAGRVGVWTKADSVTAFDDLAVKPAT